MRKVEQLFDSTDGITLSPGLELLDSTIRLVNPNSSSPQTFWFTLRLPAEVTVTEVSARCSSENSILVQVAQNADCTSAAQGYPLSQLTELVRGLKEDISICVQLQSVDGTQVSIDQISLHYDHTSLTSENLPKLGVHPYILDRSDVDACMDIIRPVGDDYELTTSLIRVDQHPIPYIILDVRSESYKMIGALPKKDNLTLHLVSDNHWGAKGLHGYGLDWTTTNGWIPEGYWFVSGIGWRSDYPGSWTCPAVSDEYPTFMVTLRKRGPNLGDYARYLIELGEFNLSVDMDDAVSSFQIGGVSVPKLDSPWQSNWQTLTIQANQYGIYVICNDSLVHLAYGKRIASGTKPKISLTETNCGGEIQGMYWGELAHGFNEATTRATVQPEIVIDHPPLALGYALYSGTRDLSSAGIVCVVPGAVMVDDRIVNVPPPPMRKGGYIYAFNDLIRGRWEYWASPIDGGMYSSIGGPWSKWHQTWLVRGLWRSLHTEGLIVQKPETSGMWVHLFARLEDASLSLRTDGWLLTALPNNQPFIFESPVDSRKAYKTIPWVWVS